MRREERSILTSLLTSHAFASQYSTLKILTTSSIYPKIIVISFKCPGRERKSAWPLGMGVVLSKTCILAI